MKSSTKNTHTLTKSDFILFLKCKNELWLKKNHKELFKHKMKPETKFLSEQGYLVQEYAEKMISETVSPKMKSEVKAIYENLYLRADIVVPTKNGVDIYEVKSSTQVKDQYVYDIAFQKYVFEKSGIKVNNVYLIKINNQYVRRGDIDVKELFDVVKLNNEVNVKLEETERLIKEANDFINGPDPELRLKDNCEDHKKCPYIQFFFPELPDYSVFDISRIHRDKLNKLLESGITNITDVPTDFELSKNQAVQVELAKTNKVICKSKEIKEIIKNLQYPLYFIDYESINYAIPEYKYYRPYQQVVFQYSLFIQKKPKANVIHKEYLADGKKDPALGILTSLKKNIKTKKGTFIVWNKSFEMARNREMAAIHPKFTDLMEQFNENVFDLMTIFSNKLYIHPEFKGKTSLKSVLPVLTYNNCYSDLDINNGQLASVMWVNLVRKKFPAKELEKTRKDLLEYCRMDTIGMVRILDFLKKIK
jgi:Domain of unknown function(DUF2779)